jgi:hypothetical protein
VVKYTSYTKHEDAETMRRLSSQILTLSEFKVIEVYNYFVKPVPPTIVFVTFMEHCKRGPLKHDIAERREAGQ